MRTTIVVGAAEGFLGLLDEDDAVFIENRKR